MSLENGEGRSGSVGELLPVHPVSVQLSAESARFLNFLLASEMREMNDTSSSSGQVAIGCSEYALAA